MLGPVTELRAEIPRNRGSISSKFKGCSSTLNRPDSSVVYLASYSVRKESSSPAVQLSGRACGHCPLSSAETKI